MTDYDLQSLKLPRLTGRALRAYAAVVENPLGRAALLNSLLENGGILKLRRTDVPDAPVFYPLVAPVETPPGQGFTPAPPPAGFPYRTSGDYARAYRDGSLSPVDVTTCVLDAIAASDRDAEPLRAFIAVDREDALAQARAAAARIAAGQALGPLDGVPLAIKDEIDVQGYPTTVGTQFLGSRPAAQDSTVAARLRAAGAVLVGKTNMHEIGINPNGSNAHLGAVRNPYDPACDTGGSSSGSGAAVAAGLVPAAIGADGGGSIRIPAALCGVVGLKPTYGRVSEAGAAPLCWSVAHLGPLAASVEDAALVYAAISGPDPREPNTLVQPPVTLAGWNRPDLRGVRLGVYPAWFEHAQPEVVSACRAMLANLQAAGASLQEIAIPHLDEMRIAHAITILAEMAVCMQAYRAQHPLHAPSTRLTLTVGEACTATDYLRAQRVRARALADFAEIYRRVDVILSPATAMSAPPIPAGGLECGWTDLGTDTEMMRYVFPGNLAGLPAISFPAGYDSRGLPVGMQAMGRHWDEALLLRIAYLAEQALPRRRAARWYDCMRA